MGAALKRREQTFFFASQANSGVLNLIQTNLGVV
jgi:hypothetical protein